MSDTVILKLIFLLIFFVHETRVISGEPSEDNDDRLILRPNDPTNLARQEKQKSHNLVINNYNKNRNVKLAPTTLKCSTEETASTGKDAADMPYDILGHVCTLNVADIAIQLYEEINSRILYKIYIHIEDVESLKSRKIWSRWGKWGRCSVTCGEGIISRKRLCVTGRCAPGEFEEQRRPCIRAPCVSAPEPVDDIRDQD